MKISRYNFETASKRFSNFENYDENKQKIMCKKIDKNTSKAMTKKRKQSKKLNK